MRLNKEGAEAAPAFASIETMEAFVVRVLPEAYRLATAMLRDPVGAEDVAHDAVLAAWDNRDRLRDRAALDAWFARIVANKCRDRLRQRSRHRVAELVELPAEREPRLADAAGATAQRDEVGRAIATLTPDEQIVLALRFGRDLEVAEIARRLGQPEGTIKSRLHLARKRMRAALAASRTRQEGVR